MVGPIRIGIGHKSNHIVNTEHRYAAWSLLALSPKLLQAKQITRPFSAAAVCMKVSKCSHLCPFGCSPVGGLLPGIQGTFPVSLRDD